MVEELKVEDWLDSGENDTHWLSVKRLVMPGAKLRIYYGENNINNMTIHIRAIVDDHQVVYKRWLKRKKRWEYEVALDYWFYLRIKYGNLSKA